MTNTQEGNKVPKVKKNFLFRWGTQNLSQAVSYILLGYLTLYATDVMGLNVGHVSIALMLSKLFDGVSDIIVGFLIDRCHSRFGKARPWEIGIIGYWLAIAFLFSMPQMSRFAGIIYLFLLYTLIYSVFATFTGCAEIPYLANVLDDSRQSISVNAFSGVITAIGSLVSSIILPQFISAAGTDPAKWSRVAWTLAIPMAILGSVRFLTIKEKADRAESVAKEKKESLMEILKVLIKNKYILILSLMLFISCIGSNLGNASGTYYAKYILGDVGYGSILALTMLPMIVMMMFAPMLVRKFGMKKVVNGCVVLGIVGGLFRLVNVSSLGITFLGSVFQVMGFPAFSIFVNSMVIDCMDYGEYKNGVRLEGSLASVQSLFNKIGTAIGTGIGGVLLALAGYDGNLDVQSSSATTMIIGLCTWIPIILYVAFAVIYHFYDLDKQMPEVRKGLGREQE